MTRTFIATIVCVLLAGCVTQQFRGSSTALQADLSELTQCAGTSCGAYSRVAASSIERSDKHVLTFLDLDSDGSLRSKEQLPRITQEIEAIGKDQKAMVVMFVHGWNHSSRPLDEHLVLFRTVLDDLHGHFTTQKRRVIGIYVSWPAWTMVKPLNFATFFSRSAAAAEIGASVTFRESIDRIQEAIRQSRNGGADIAVASVGHSLGGKLLFSSLEECLQQTTLCRNEVPPLRELPQFGEVVLLINPAQDVNDYENFPEYVQANKYGSLERPTLLTLASEKDSVVRHVFHYGRIVKTVFTPKKWRAFRSETIGLGQNGDHTHILCLSGDSERARLATRSKLCAGESNGGSVVPLKHGRLTALQKPPGPFWIVRVDGRLVGGHSDIFTREFSDTLREIVTFATSERPPANPMPSAGSAPSAMVR
jgi:hypothetical protein